MVQGDTATSLAVALSAFNQKKKIIYIESGLRSYDFEHPYPEEGYRQLIARIADYNFCPTSISKINLLNENILGKSFVVGNTALDNLLDIKKNAKYKNIVPVTLHRRENLKYIDEWFKNLNIIAQQNQDLEFILPLHANPLIKKYKNLLNKLKILNNLNHSDFLKLLKDAKFIITDSGGIQEEGSF